MCVYILLFLLVLFVFRVLIVFTYLMSYIKIQLKEADFEGGFQIFPHYNRYIINKLILYLTLIIASTNWLWL